jgi:hypothetical protein
MFITQPRNCALIGSIPSGIFEGDGSILPKTTGHSTSDNGGTKLVGYFNPNDTGNVSGSTYNNLVSGEMDLAIYNGMSYTTGFVDGAGFWSETSGTLFDGKIVDASDFRLTRYFESDGADDFLGPMLSFSEGYIPDVQETGLYLNAGDGPSPHGGYQNHGWAMCMWVNFPQQAWGTSGNVLFSCGRDAMDDRSTLAYTLETGFAYQFGLGATYADTQTHIKPIEADRWYFVAYQNNGTRSFLYNDDGTEISVDGKILPLRHEYGEFLKQGRYAMPIYIGGYYEQYEIDPPLAERAYDVSKSGTKFGMMLLYSGEIGINRIIQNYIATRDMYNRNSGEKDPYFVESQDTFTY